MIEKRPNFKYMTFAQLLIMLRDTTRCFDPQDKEFIKDLVEEISKRAKKLTKRL